jgi:hypothetical protein
VRKQRGDATVTAVVMLLILGIVVAILALMFGLPIYNVWQQGLAGEAELKRAEQTRQVMVVSAKAKLDSATYLNQAEIKRAEGVSAANKIIADGLGGPEGYLRYLWIQAIEHDKQASVIYIPTEAGLPILEAGKRK